MRIIRNNIMLKIATIRPSRNGRFPSVFGLCSQHEPTWSFAGMQKAGEVLGNVIGARKGAHYDALTQRVMQIDTRRRRWLSLGVCPQSAPYFVNTIFGRPDVAIRWTPAVRYPPPGWQECAGSR